MKDEEIVEMMMKGGWPEYYHDSIARDDAKGRLQKAIAALRAHGMEVAHADDIHCPRPANGDPDNITARQCVEKGNCGCTYRTMITAATPTAGK